MKTKIVDVAKLTDLDIAQMFRVMDQYYEKVVEKTFRRDLAEKQKVILLLGRDGGIKGFSTILERPMRIDGHSFLAVFSGDTVLQNEYWGNGALSSAFGRYLIRLKATHPFTSIYWFLISKGYKTYLMMTNNLISHYPRYERETPARFKTIMNEFYSLRFGEAYNSKSGVIRSERSKSSFIRPSFTDVSTIALTNPRVAFFEDRNPNWQNGDELACVAHLTVGSIVHFALRRLSRLIRFTKMTREKTKVMELRRSI